MMEALADAHPRAETYLPAVAALQARFGFTRSHSYDLIARGTVRAVKAGSRILITESEMARFALTFVPFKTKKAA